MSHSLFGEDDKKNLTVSKPFLVVNLTNTQLTELFFFHFSDITIYYDITTNHNVTS